MSTEDMKIVPISMPDIFSDPEFNCRGSITPGEVYDLRDSIKNIGLQQPVVVQPYNKNGYKYRIIMGHRRHAAIKLLKWSEVPCIIRENIDEIHARAMNLVENLQRADLTFMQGAKAIEKFLVAGITVADVAKMLNKSTGWVQVRYTALKLPKDIQIEIDSGFINQEQIKELYQIAIPDLQYAAVRKIKDSRLRGEKQRIKIITETKSEERKPHEKKIRNITNIFKMQDHIQETVGNNIGTRCLAWCAGMISDYELYEDIKKVAEEAGIYYEIPAEAKPLEEVTT